MAKRSADLIIAGSGPVGLVTALAARKTLGDRARILVCDPNLSVDNISVRTYAISASPRRLLENLGVWQTIQDKQPILRMEISDSQLRDITRQIFLAFETSDSEAPLADMIGHTELMQSLNEASHLAGIQLLRSGIASVSAGESSVSVTLSNGEIFATRLLVGCDGANSEIRNLAHIPVTGWSYERNAIVATIGIEREHNGVAIQHFLPAGTLALLPLTGKRYSIVWVEKPEDARVICTLGRNEFLAALLTRTGNAHGHLELLDGPQHYPLRLQIARRSIGKRIVLLGDAAHTMHPIAGQGLNLGLRDVAYLMDIISEQHRLGLDFGAGAALMEYEQSRRFETVRMLLMTDAIFRLFTQKSLPARLLRDFGLGVVDRLPLLKKAMIREAAGVSEKSPALLRAS